MRAPAALVTFMGFVGSWSAAEASLRNGFLRVETGARVSVTKKVAERDIEGHRALATSTDDFVCMNGYPGIQTDDVCCSLQCGTCGGDGCSGLPGGEDSCCTSNIKEDGSSCSDVDAAPCFIEDEIPTPSPIDTGTPACMNGYPGIQWGDVCCSLECETCGGVGCSGRSGGEDSCCTSNIWEDGSSCSEVDAAPCFFEDGEPPLGPTPTPTATVTSACSNGLPGVQRDNVCCAMECGTCGGFKCNALPGGTESCCTSSILDAGISCNDVDAGPCVIDVEPTPSPTMMPTTMSTCSNGLPGVEQDNVCCAMGCGTCGGFKCNTLPGGEDSCCISRILDAGVSCNDVDAGPCIIDVEPTPSPTMMPTMMSTCSNGLPGVQRDNVCCAMGCGTCGGFKCNTLPGGAESCCMSNILDAGVSCNDVDVGPCIIEPTPSPTMMPTVMPTEMPTMMPTVMPTMMPTVMPTMMPTPLLTCSNGLPGIQLDNICCAMGCGTCGGVGCSGFPGGEDSCCTSRILADGILCKDVNEGPCIIEDEPTPSPTMMPTMKPTMKPTPFLNCSNGLPGVQLGDVCCALGCGICGGVGCSGFPGGEDSCCTSRILDAGISCNDAGEAPCLIVDPTPTPIATMGPTTMVPTGMPSTGSPTMTPIPTMGSTTTMPTPIATTGPSTMMPTGMPSTGSPTMTPIPTMGSTTTMPTPIATMGPTTMVPTGMPSTGSPTMTPIPTMVSTTTMPTPIATTGPTTTVPTGMPSTGSPTMTPIPTMAPTTTMPTPIATTGPTIMVPTGMTGSPTMTPIPTMVSTTTMPTPIATTGPSTMMPTGMPSTGSPTMTPIPTMGSTTTMPTPIATMGPTTMVPTGMPSTGSPTMTPIPTMVSTTTMPTPIATTGPTTTVPTGMPSTGSPTMTPIPTMVSTTTMPTAIPSAGPTNIMPSTESPTIMSTMVPTVMPTIPTCSNGLPGFQFENVCCAIECGACGDAGCRDLPGGADSCCTSRVLDAGISCNDAGEAPCLIVDPTPTPIATTGPTTMVPTGMPSTGSPTMTPIPTMGSTTTMPTPISTAGPTTMMPTVMPTTRSPTMTPSPTTGSPMTMPTAMPTPGLFTMGPTVLLTTGSPA